MEYADVPIPSQPPSDLVGGSAKRAFLLVIDHNPLLMLSGVSMLVGCFMISWAVHQDDSRLWALVSLLVAFNLYEIAVIALGMYLARDRGLVRDGGVLLLLEALLLVDVTFLYNEVAMVDLTVGLAIAVGGLVLAMLKLGAIDHVLGLGLTRRAWAVLGSGFVLLFGVPPALRALASDGFVPDWALYGGWWLLAGWLMWFALPGSWRLSDEGGMGATAGLRRLLRAALVGLPAVSVAAHLAGAHWVYGRPMWWADMAPLMVAGTAILIRHGPGRLPRVALVPVTFGCVMLAALMATHFNDGLIARVWPGIDVSPLRVTMLWGAALSTWAWWRLGGALFIGEAVMMLGLAVAGHTPGAIRDNLGQLRGRSGRWVSDHFPTTALQWGVIAVVSAFVLLGLGAWVSLMKKPRGGVGAMGDGSE